MNSAGRPHFEIGQAVLVDEGRPGEITAVKRGTVLGVLDLPPLDTWLYYGQARSRLTSRPGIPEYNFWWPRRRDSSRRTFRQISQFCSISVRGGKPI